VVRVIILCERPQHLSAEHAIAWLRRASAEAVATRGVAALRLTQLQNPSPTLAPMATWLIEAELERGADAAAIVASAPWRDLLGDLRLLGMRPSVAVADSARATALETA
jgi:hypothetical protein